MALLSCAGCDEQQAATPAQSPPPAAVEVVQLVAQDVPVTTEFVGRTASSQRVEIRARVDGYLDEIVYTEGEMVEKGDVLFRLDPKPFEARLRAAKAELAQHTARLENAQALLDRIEPLVEAEAVAQKELDDAIGQVRSSAAAVEAASAGVFQAELDLGYTTIVSPARGRTSEASAREGAYIDFSSPALTYVARLDPIWVEFSVSETQVLAGRRASREGKVLHPDDGAFDVSIVLADGTRFPHTGEISFADASISDRTGTFLLRAELPNPDEALRPGQYVRVLLDGAYRPDTFLVPQRAVRQGPRGPFVWVVDKDGKAEQRPVTLGPWIDDAWVIEDGLAADERLIVNGSVGITPGREVSIVSIVRTPAAPERESE